jgi:solute carrier family 25 phosphate transporter 23/24/25/41
MGWGGVGWSLSLSLNLHLLSSRTHALHPPPHLQIAMSLVCGAAAGLASSTATFPLDLVRRRMQVEGAGRPASAPGAPTYASVARSVWAARGLRGFYSGLMPEYYKVAPGVAIGFCTYELCREVLGVRPGLAFR